MNQLIITKSVENHAYFLENGLFSQNNWMDDIQTHKKILKQICILFSKEAWSRKICEGQFPFLSLLFTNNQAIQSNSSSLPNF